MATELHIADELEKELPQYKIKVPKELLVTPSLNKLFIHGLTDWLIIIICWFFIAYLPFYCYIVIAPVIASRFHAFGVILHDVSHMPLRKKNIKVRLLEIIIGYSMGSTINAMRYHHLRHHKDTCMDTDPYFSTSAEKNTFTKIIYVLRSVVLIPFFIVRSVYGTFSFYIPAMRNTYGRIFLQDKSKLDLTLNKEVIQCADEDRWQFLYLSFVFTLVCALFSFSVFLYYYIIPILIMGLFAGYRLISEHNYSPAHDRKMETIIKHTTDHHLTGIASFFIAPRNIGYHVAHHLHPQVSWYALPQLTKWYEKNYPHLFSEKSN